MASSTTCTRRSSEASSRTRNRPRATTDEPSPPANTSTCGVRSSACGSTASTRGLSRWTTAASAVDRDALIEEIHLGKHTAARGIVPPGTLGFNPALAAPGYDPRRARALLAEAGYPGGRGLSKIEIWSSVTNDAILREHDLIRRSLAAIGIEAEVKYLTDWPAFSKALTEGRLPIFLYAWFADVPDPDNFLTKLFHSKSPRNYARYHNPVVDELLTAARTTADPQRRVELYRRAEQVIMDDAVIVPVWHYNYERLFQPWVRSVEVNGLGDPYIPMRKVWLAR